MVRDCELPDRLRIFTYLDLRSPAEFDSQMQRLINAIRSPEAQPRVTPMSSPSVSPKPKGFLGFDHERGLARLGDMLATADVKNA